MIELRRFQPVIGGKPLLTPLSVKIADGQFCVLTAASGAGKSRLLETLTQPNLPHLGAFTVSGACATVPQSLDFCPSLGALDTVCTSRLEAMSWRQSLFGFPESLQKEAEAQLDLFHFSPDREKPVGLLSGGERQRIALARLGLTSRTNWLLDEPVSQLDPESALACLSQLKRLAQERRAAVLCVLHHPQLAEALADHRLHWAGDWRTQ